MRILIVAGALYGHVNTMLAAMPDAARVLAQLTAS